MPVPRTPKTPSKPKAPAANGDAPAPIVAASDVVEPLPLLPGGRPDKKAYDAEQDRTKAEIDALQLKLTAVREKIGIATKGPGAAGERRTQLRNELNEIRSQQSSGKLNRDGLLEKIKNLQDSVAQKVKDLQAAKSKIPYKSIAEIDARVQQLEKQVESGSMKLADEKRAIQEISTCKRNRRLLEGFQTEEASIEAERAKVDALRKERDDPEAKALSDRYDALKKEFEDLNKEADALYADRNKLFEERDTLQAKLNVLFERKRARNSEYKNLNDQYYKKLTEDRERRAERAKAQRDAEVLARKKEIAQQLREEAEIPAYQAQIEDCQNLIDFFSGKSSGNVTYKSTTASTGSLFTRPEVTGVPKLEIRKVEEAPEGFTPLKKKGEEQQAYFIASKGKKGGKKSAAPPSPAPAPAADAAPAADSSGTLHIPLATLTALLSFSIQVPDNAADVPRVISDLNTKKAWYEANNARVTAEKIAKAEAEIQRLSEIEAPVEPTPTPLEGPTSSAASSAAPEDIEAKLEAVQEES